jgi:hypothetical protein
MYDETKTMRVIISWRGGVSRETPRTMQEEKDCSSIHWRYSYAVHSFYYLHRHTTMSTTSSKVMIHGMRFTDGQAFEYSESSQAH